MDNQTLSPASRQIEALLDNGGKNALMDFLRQESLRQVEASGSVASNYDIFAVRRNEQLGDEIFGPKSLHVGTYSEEALYGAAGSPIVRFRSAIQALKVRAERTTSMNVQEVEYGHQVALVWAEVGRLKEFIGVSPVISEIVAELRTARFQFLGKDTPTRAMESVASGLSLVIEAKRFDASLVDRLVETLERGGIDSLGPDALRNSDG
jgi:hypothetical protein